MSGLSDLQTRERNMYVGRLAIQQRVLPEYRVGFFDSLAGRCARGLEVFIGEPLPQEGIAVSEKLGIAKLTQGHNWHFRHPASSMYLCWQGGLLRWLEGRQPDVLIVEANSRLLSTRLAIGWMHARGRPVLGWGLGAPYEKGILRWLRGLERMAFLRSLDGWIAYSHRGAEEYRQLGLDPQKVFISGNAVTSRPEEPPSVRSKPSESPRQVLFVGRLQRRKRIDLLLLACARLPESLQPRLIIVGEGPDRAEIETQAKIIYPRAEFLGEKHGETLASLFREADLFVLPGTGGLAVQQAMHYGLPVIVAQGDGTQADLVRPENGWLVPPDDLDALEQALQGALVNSDRLRKMGTESYRIVRDEANLEHMVDVFIQAIQVVSDSPEN